jgi:hypothetical protein
VKCAWNVCLAVSAEVVLPALRQINRSDFFFQKQTERCSIPTRVGSQFSILIHCRIIFLHVEQLPPPPLVSGLAQLAEYANQSLEV